MSDIAMSMLCALVFLLVAFEAAAEPSFDARSKPFNFPRQILILNKKNSRWVIESLKILFQIVRSVFYADEKIYRGLWCLKMKFWTPRIYSPPHISFILGDLLMQLNDLDSEIEKFKDSMIDGTFYSNKDPKGKWNKSWR